MYLIHKPVKGRQNKTKLTFHFNCAGQGGLDFIWMDKVDGGIYTLHFETQEEVTELLRQAAFVRMNKESN